MYAHLHVHSWFSFLEGLDSPANLVQAAAANQMSALALTDSHNLSGAVDFYNACLERQVHPIFGLEVLQAPALPTPAGESPPILSPEPGRLVLLAETDSGWASLCHLASLGQEKGCLSLSDIQRYHQGLLCLSGGSFGILHRLLLHQEKESAKKSALEWLVQLQAIFNDRLYVELEQHQAADRMICVRLAALAHRMHIPVVASHNIYYLQPSQASLQALVSAIRLNTPLSQLPPSSVAPLGASFLSTSEMAERFSSFPNALSATLEIAERCQGKPPLHIPHYPEAPLPAGSDPQQILRQRAEAGAIRLYGTLTSPVHERLEHEMDVIIQRGFTSIFLIMAEIISFAHQQGIPTASRGSASSSLVAHCLGITTPDPLKHDLYFERFLNPARKTPPDIDTDLCSRRRDEVLHFVAERYGKDKVAMVSTISRFRSRSALREVAKAYGIPGSQISQMTEQLPWMGFGARAGGSSGDPFASLKPRFHEPIHELIFRDAAALVGVPDHLSVHPGGMVIVPLPIQDLVPTQLAPKGLPITQFDLESIEQIGLVKLDLLGIRGLSVLGEVAESLARQASPPCAPLSFLEAIPINDDSTSSTVRLGKTIGCFQIESPGMRSTLREIQASSIDDILVALALYRPGPLTGGLKDAFVRRHLGVEPSEQLHPALTPLLSDTYGVILYQEQVLRIAHELGGFSLSDSDMLRRAMSHFDPGREMQTLRQKFIAAAIERKGVPETTAQQIWDLMAAFAGYGFPKAHAASYAVISWRAAWCKTHYPELFITAVLAGGGGYYPQRVYLNEARRLGLKLRPPEVNHANPSFSFTYQQDQPILWMGLGQVKDLTRQTLQRILQGRPFHSLPDFLARVDPRPVEALHLARCGALAELGTIPEILQQLQTGWVKGQMPLFPHQTSGGEDWPLEEKIQAQMEILGVGIDAHPLELAANRLGHAITTLEAAGRLHQPVTVAGMRQTWRRRPNENGQLDYILSLEDLEGILEVRIPARVYRRDRAALAGAGPYLVEGRMELASDAEEPFLLAYRITVV